MIQELMEPGSVRFNNFLIYVPFCGQTDRLMDTPSCEDVNMHVRVSLMRCAGVRDPFSTENEPFSPF